MDETDRTVPRSQKTRRRVLMGLLLTSLALVALVLSPFAPGLFLAAVFAAALRPIHCWLAGKLRGHESIAAGLLILAVVLLLIVPLAVIVVVAVQEAVEGVEYLRETLETQGLAGLTAHLPGPVERFLESLGDYRPDGEALAAQGTWIARLAGRVLGAAGGLLIQLLLMLIALFFLLVDGNKLINWAVTVAPLRRAQSWEFLREFRRVSVAVLVSSLVTASIQAAAALIGYLIARVPHPLFFTTVTFLIAFIPAIGAGSVVMAVALLLLLTGQPWMALFLALWGGIVVGLVDNLVKPLLIKGEVPLHGAVIFFALLGGIAVFGLVGLVAGPLIMIFALTAIRVITQPEGASGQAVKEELHPDEHPEEPSSDAA